jgi:hypothetical protein
MSSRQKAIAVFSGVVMTIITIFGFPSQAKALQLAERIKCSPDLPNKLWTPVMAKAYAKFVMENYGWTGRNEFRALVKLWDTESHWNSLAYNHEVGDPKDGSHAGGIPQILGLSTRVPAPLQIDAGLAYIHHRYGKPSVAWAFHRRNNYY